MNRNAALNILKLPKNATRTQIEESYNQLRELYYPYYYGAPHEFTPQQIQESLYADLSRDRYKEPKGIQYKDFVKDTYHFALLEYARVCGAYDYLTDPANQNKYNVDPRSPYGHDVLRYGKVFGDIRRVITWLVSWIAMPVLIVFLISWLLDVMGGGAYWYFTVTADVSKILYLVLMGSAAVTMPLDVLGYIPRGITEGMREGAQTQTGILKPLCVLWKGIWGGLGRIFNILWRPGEMMDERYYYCDPPVKNAKKGRAAAEAWYKKTVSNMETFHDICTIRISDKMPVIRSALEDLVLRIKRARMYAAWGVSWGDMQVQQAEKNYDRMDRVGWPDSTEMEEALDDISKARAERARAADSAGSELQYADRLLHAFAYRAGADLKKYTDEK